MLSAISALFYREISLAETVGQIESIKRAYLGKNGIIRQMERALWKPTLLKKR